MLQLGTSLELIYDPFWFWFGLVLYCFGLKTNVGFVWFSFCCLLFILPPLWFCVSVRFDWCLKSFYLCIWFLFYSLYFSASFFSGYSLPFFWGFANVCCYFVLLSRFLFFCIFLFRLLFTFFFFGFANVCCRVFVSNSWWACGLAGSISGIFLKLTHGIAEAPSNIYSEAKYGIYVLIHWGYYKFTITQ